MAKRKLSWTTRFKLRQNALEATRKWQRMSHKERVKARHKKYYSWGWEGKAPHTKPRPYAFKRKPAKKKSKKKSKKK